MSSLAPYGTGDNALIIEPKLMIQLDNRTTTRYGEDNRWRYDYIHSISMEYRLIDPNGNSYTSEFMLREAIETSYTGSGAADPTMDIMLQCVNTVLSISSIVVSNFFYSAFTLGANLILAQIGTSYSGTVESVKEIDAGLYKAYWRIDYEYYLTSVKPGDIHLIAMSMSNPIFTVFNSDAVRGPYQLQITWAIRVKHALQEDASGTWWSCYDRYVLMDNYYINFELT
ncbi:hypothetical protein ES708_29835 [subsurface metagenome]